MGSCVGGRNKEQLYRDQSKELPLKELQGPPRLDDFVDGGEKEIKEADGKEN